MGRLPELGASERLQERPRQVNDQRLVKRECQRGHVVRMRQPVGFAAAFPVDFQERESQLLEELEVPADRLLRDLGLVRHVADRNAMPPADQSAQQDPLPLDRGLVMHGNSFPGLGLYIHSTNIGDLARDDTPMSHSAGLSPP